MKKPKLKAKSSTAAAKLKIASDAVSDVFSYLKGKQHDPEIINLRQLIYIGGLLHDAQRIYEGRPPINDDKKNIKP